MTWEVAAVRMESAVDNMAAITAANVIPPSTGGSMAEII